MKAYNPLLAVAEMSDSTVMDFWAVPQTSAARGKELVAFFLLVLHCAHVFCANKGETVSVPFIGDAMALMVWRKVPSAPQMDYVDRAKPLWDERILQGLTKTERY